MIANKRKAGRKRESIARVWRGVVTLDARGPDFFYDENHFPDPGKNWQYGEPPEFVKVEVRELLPTKRRRKR